MIEEHVTAINAEMMNRKLTPSSTQDFFMNIHREEMRLFKMSEAKRWLDPEYSEWITTLTTDRRVIYKLYTVVVRTRDDFNITT